MCSSAIFTLFLYAILCSSANGATTSSGITTSTPPTESSPTMPSTTTPTESSTSSTTAESSTSSTIAESSTSSTSSTSGAEASTIGFPAFTVGSVMTLSGVSLVNFTDDMKADFEWVFLEMLANSSLGEEDISIYSVTVVSVSEVITRRRLLEAKLEIELEIVFVDFDSADMATLELIAVDLLEDADLLARVVVGVSAYPSFASVEEFSLESKGVTIKCPSVSDTAETWLLANGTVAATSDCTGDKCQWTNSTGYYCEEQDLSQKDWCTRKANLPQCSWCTDYAFNGWVNACADFQNAIGTMPCDTDVTLEEQMVGEKPMKEWMAGLPQGTKLRDVCPNTFSCWGCSPPKKKDDSIASGAVSEISIAVIVLCTVAMIIM